MIPEDASYELQAPTEWLQPLEIEKFEHDFGRRMVGYGEDDEGYGAHLFTDGSNLYVLSNHSRAGKEDMVRASSFEDAATEIAKYTYYT